MRCSAQLIWRLPLRSRRCRLVLPDEAGIGAAPASRASLASVAKRSAPAISPISLAAVSAPQPASASSCGASSATSVASSRSSSAIARESSRTRRSSSRGRRRATQRTEVRPRADRGLSGQPVAGPRTYRSRRTPSPDTQTISLRELSFSDSRVLGSSPPPACDVVAGRRRIGEPGVTAPMSRDDGSGWLPARGHRCGGSEGRAHASHASSSPALECSPR